MPFSFGAALSELGNRTPGIVESFRTSRKDEEERKLAERQKLIEELGMKKLGLEIGGMETEQSVEAQKRARMEEAIKKLQEGISSKQQYETEQAAFEQQSQAYKEQNPETSEQVDFGAASKPKVEPPVEPKQPSQEYLAYGDNPAVKEYMDYERYRERLKMADKKPDIAGVFQPGTREYDLADKIAKGQITWNQGLQAFVGFGNKTGKREDLINTVFEINPDYKSSEGEGQYRAAIGEAQIPVKARTAAATGSSGTRAREETTREVQREQPMFSAEQANKISQSGLALKNLQRIRDALSGGKVEYFDIIKKSGQFTNPQVNNAYQQVSEIVGRGQSGAAIADHEWKNFGKEILNPQFLLTEQGKKTALENIDDYIDRFYSNGELITSDPEWYGKYNVRGKMGREKVSGGSAGGWETINGISVRRKK
jgi:hypothetical protein